MIEFVRNFIIENNLLNKKILVGLSGGVDSVVLSDILSKIKEIKLVVIHLNHNWRGEESKKDEEFARNFARKLGIEFYSETLDENSKKSETTARELRYDFFKRCKIKFGADAVFLAHNKNDNVETLIYRLAKGTGPKGLISIPEVRDFYYRPLINVSRFEIEKYAKENNLEHIVDSSNFDIKYKRNLIRNEVIPLLKEINPEVINSISSFIHLNKMSQNIVERVVSDALYKVKNGDKILRDKFLALEIEIQYEIINKILQNVIKTRDFKTIDKILNFIKNNTSSKISLGDKKFLKVYDNKIYILEKNEKESYQTPFVLGENKISGYKIFVEKCAPPEKFPDNNSNIQYVKLDFNLPYVLRTRKEGDKIVPFAQKTYQKLKTLFIKKKIPNELRNQIPLIALDDEILYASGVIISEKLRVDKNDKICYKITVAHGE